MMSQDDQFVWISPKERIIEYQPYPEHLQHHGKWIIYGQKDVIEGLGSRMLALVGKNGISRAKFTKNPALDVHEGYELGKDHALIVYCDGREREKVKDKLKKELGVDKMFWKNHKEHMEEVLKSKVY